MYKCERGCNYDVKLNRPLQDFAWCVESVDGINEFDFQLLLDKALEMVEKETSMSVHLRLKVFHLSMNYMGYLAGYQTQVP